MADDKRMLTDILIHLPNCKEIVLTASTEKATIGLNTIAPRWPTMRDRLDSRGFSQEMSMAYTTGSANDLQKELTYAINRASSVTLSAIRSSGIHIEAFAVRKLSRFTSHPESHSTGELLARFLPLNVHSLTRFEFNLTFLGHSRHLDYGTLAELLNMMVGLKELDLVFARGAADPKDVSVMAANWMACVCVGVHLPNLCVLRLRGLELNRNNRIPQLLQRHRGTLRCLDLQMTAWSRSSRWILPLMTIRDALSLDCLTLQLKQHDMRFRRDWTPDCFKWQKEMGENEKNRKITEMMMSYTAVFP